MIKSKLVSSALSLAILCSVSVVNAETSVVGKLTANPSAVIGTGITQHTVNGSSIAYIEGDSVTTGSDSSASINLTSGAAQVVIAPNTVMSVLDAKQASLSLTQGAISVKAQSGQVVSILTSIGSYELSSQAAINAVAVFENGEFSAISKEGSLTVTSQQGSVVTVVDTNNAFVSNGQNAKSVDVQGQAGTLAGTTTAGTTTAATTAAITSTAVTVGVGVGVVGIGVGLGEGVSDAGDADENQEAIDAEAEQDEASPTS